MSIPDFQAIMLPLLQLIQDGREHRLRDTVDTLANVFGLTEEERLQLLPSQTQRVFDNRVGWSKTHLLKAGVLESTRRSYFKITERGNDLLRTAPQQVNMNLLKQFPEYMEFLKPSNTGNGTEITAAIPQVNTPQEVMSGAYEEIRRTTALELLTKVKQCPPAFFEKLVVDLLVKMGYGGSLKDAGNATRLTNDGGIDGIIKEDKLGLDVIYIQAKRWDNQPVGRPDVQSFVGALDGQKASKGVFITTSRFGDNVKEYVKNISKKVVLIDGEQLAYYMMDYEIGVAVEYSYIVKKIDHDYFDE